MTQPLSLVTGACGFTGTHMLEVLHEAGHRIRATDLAEAYVGDDRKRGRFPSVLKRLGVEFVPADLTKPETLAPLVTGVDYVFHIASVFNYSVPWTVLRKVNVEGTRQLVDLCQGRQRLRRFVLWGAGGVYGHPRPDDLPLKESLAPNPPNAYLESKWRQEFLVMEKGRLEGFPYTIVRPTTVYGPRGVYGGGQLVRDAASMPLAIVPWNFHARVPTVHVRDVCRAALHLALEPGARGEIYNVNDDSQLSTRAFIHFIARTVGHVPITSLPVPIGPLKLLMQGVATVDEFISRRVLGRAPKLEVDSIGFLGCDFVYSNEKLKSTGFRFEYPDVRDGLRQTIKWYRDEGWL